jgi:redox-sensitive bicupin YhaK (pirin superfamily)
MVGPFVFWDHMGPADFPPGVGLDVRPHPHIGLATVTYLFTGAFVHRDSLGSEVTITPGAINWMIAGRGIVHSERTGADLRGSGGRVEGIQVWVALPTADEEMEPAFEHHPADTLPELRIGGATLRVLAGSAFGATSPVGVRSPTLYVEARLDAGATLTIPPEHAERAIYVVSGAPVVDGRAFAPTELLVLRSGGDVVVTAREATHLMLLGGAPLDGPRHIWWNLVSSRPERIEQAARKWEERGFGAVPGDDVEFIPLPENLPFPR